MYSEFVNVFSKTKAEMLAPHRPIDHAIDLELGFKIPYGRIYNLSEFKLRTLKAYIDTNLANGFIQRSSSSAAAPIFLQRRKTAAYDYAWTTGRSIRWRSKTGTHYPISGRCLTECAELEYPLSWTSGTPTTSSGLKKETHTGLHSGPTTASPNTESCPAD